MRSCVILVRGFGGFFYKTLLYLMDYFNTVLKRPSMKLPGKLEKIKYIDAGGSKFTHALTRDQQYNCFCLIIIIIIIIII